MVFELVPWWAGEQRGMEDFGDKGHDGSKRQGGEKCSAWQSLSHFYQMDHTIEEYVQKESFEGLEGLEEDLQGKESD